MKKKLDQDDQILTRKWKEVVYLAVLFLAAALMNGFLMLRNPNMGADALKFHSAFHSLVGGKGWRFYTGILPGLIRAMGRYPICFICSAEILNCRVCLPHRFLIYCSSQQSISRFDICSIGGLLLSLPVGDLLADAHFYLLCQSDRLYLYLFSFFEFLPLHSKFTREENRFQKRPAGFFLGVCLYDPRQRAFSSPPLVFWDFLFFPA